MVVYPNTEERLTRIARAAPVSKNRLTTGIPNLDAVLGGGYQSGSTTMALGFSGSGKTLLGLHFLAGGEEPGLHFGFYESPGRLVETADRLGLPLRARVASGEVDLVWQPARRYGLDALALRLLDNVSRRQVKRIVIDGFDGLRQASAADPERVTAYLNALLNELRALDVTVIITEETSKALGPEIEVRVEGISAMVENIILLDYVDVGSELRRLMSVIKQRGGGFADAIRELRITDTGMGLADTPETALGILARGTVRSMPFHSRARRGPGEREPG